MVVRAISFSITDSNTVVREGIEQFINRNQIRMMFSTPDTDELLARLKISDILPDICIISCKKLIPGSTDFVRQIKDHWPGIKVLIVQHFYVEFFLIEAIDNGISGFLSPIDCGEDFSEAIMAICNGNEFYSKDDHTHLVNKVKAGIIQRMEFTEQEMTLMKLGAAYQTYKGISEQLNKKTDTVKELCYQLFEKIGLKEKDDLDNFLCRTESSLYRHFK